MANDADYDRAAGRVASGTASGADYELVKRMARNASGRRPAEARRALEEDKKRNDRR